MNRANDERFQRKVNNALARLGRRMSDVADLVVAEDGTIAITFDDGTQQRFSEHKSSIQPMGAAPTGGSL